MSIQACADLVQRGDPDRFLATMAAPREARAVLFPLYAFNLEVARAPWVTDEPMIAEMRLQWWRDALEEIGASGPVRRHEVVDALAPLLDAEAVSLLDDLIAARMHDMHDFHFADDAEFDDYIDRTSGNLMWAAARALGATNAIPVRDLGFASGLVAWFRAQAALAERGRQPLVGARRQSLRAMAERGLTALDRARSGAIERSARPALLSAWETEPMLRLVQREPARVEQGQLSRPEFARRFGLLRQAWSGRF